MVAGATVRTVELSARSGRTVRAEIVRPDLSAGNVAELRRASDAWDADARLLEGPEQRRAFFAASVAFEAASILAADGCCVAVAQEAATGEVLGVVTYDLKAGEWHLDNMALAPRRQANRLNPDPLRGIGTALLRVVAEDVQARACARLEIWALDEDAERFWRGRGFHDTDQPLHLTCPEVRELAEELSHSHPDLPDEGDLPFACDRDRWRQVELPEVRELLGI